MRKFHQIPGSKEEISSQPSRIVLLRPTPGKPSTSKAKLTSRANSFQLINRNSLNGSIDTAIPTTDPTIIPQNYHHHKCQKSNVIKKHPRKY